MKGRERIELFKNTENIELLWSCLLSFLSRQFRNCYPYMLLFTSGLDYCNSSSLAFQPLLIPSFQLEQNYAACSLYRCGTFTFITYIQRDLRWIPIKFRSSSFLTIVKNSFYSFF